ncbi:YqaA family protein [Enterobacillus tribolii]|uniref:Membrane protein YqaA with SNARE-associated domain n=1 Tax=Enterobacillus tribolii TaxID=1487935 RepID=A0A370Q934_9GAMM|nr:YqaA family protein [Enterobacillus tribolii]MBW7984570.1 DedA family protein [Enterobacillus tribolii]RDK84560.1 membrane protein YqaA with SNARE-associated domain [Enterobacillus tribolii]
MNDFLTLGGMFASSFLSATLLPGNSEIVLTVLLLAERFSPWLLVSVAVVGNVLGGMTNVVIGRLLPEIKHQRGLAPARRWLEKYGAPALLLSWVPVIGDLLCVLAGWMRLSWMPVVVYLTVGKALRYVVVAVVTLYGIQGWSNPG